MKKVMCVFLLLVLVSCGKNPVPQGLILEKDKLETITSTYAGKQFDVDIIFQNFERANEVRPGQGEESMFSLYFPPEETQKYVVLSLNITNHGESVNADHILGNTLDKMFQMESCVPGIISEGSDALRTFSAGFNVVHEVDGRFDVSPLLEKDKPIDVKVIGIASAEAVDKLEAIQVCWGEEELRVKA